MAYMFEIFYPPPANSTKESVLARQVSEWGGRLDFREEGNQKGEGGICLTFESEDLEAAKRAADTLRQQGEHIEGLMDYGA